MKRLGITLCIMVYAAACAAALDINTQDMVLREYMWEEFTASPAAERPKIGVALSAGGARGFAHVGVLEVLSNASVPIDMMTGTSMGAVVGSIYASGLPIKDIWDLGKTAQISYVTDDFTLPGVIRFFFGKRLPSSQNFEGYINEKVGKKRFEDLDIPFACAAMDVKTGEKVLFNKGPVGIAVRASMNLPGVFEPVQYRQRLLVDGGVVDYLPVDQLKQMGAEYIIAVWPRTDFSAKTPDTVAEYFMRTADIRGSILVEETIKKANFAITPVVTDISVLDSAMLPAAGEKGLVEANRVLAKLKEDILLFNVTYEKAD
ncbi:patatin-like phospholipase family protein [Parelusimicrobium proximum]|uniref:patatin-like phospholipase family protein n=1 Tax=Parelusimicrobium proximum TaxID=3228953 RepID=UPI003D16CB58